jgi:hypothetical protein
VFDGTYTREFEFAPEVQLGQIERVQIVTATS